MSPCPRVVTIRYASALPFEQRQHGEERVRATLRQILGDVLIRFEETVPGELLGNVRVRLTGPWQEPVQVVATVAAALAGLARAA